MSQVRWDLDSSLENFQQPDQESESEQLEVEQTEDDDEGRKEE